MAQGRGKSILIQAIPKDGIWFKVKEEAKRQPEEHAGELIPQSIAGKRTIQGFCKRSESVLSNDFSVDLP
jgi:hypothetical protein